MKFTLTSDMDMTFTNAFEASLVDGAFPIGPEFITYRFLPDGRLETLTRHS